MEFANDTINLMKGVICVLLKTFMFDEKVSSWTNNRSFNFMYLRTMEQYFNDTIRYKGYIYLNRICEMLGIEWNPDDENPCIKNNGVDCLMYVEFEVFEKPNESFLVLIHSHD